MANRISIARLRIPNFSLRLNRWAIAVLTATPRDLATSLLLSPSDSSFRTCRSRGVKRDRASSSDSGGAVWSVPPMIVSARALS